MAMKALCENMNKHLDATLVTHLGQIILYLLCLHGCLGITEGI